ncbi:hypothetical protein QYM36_000803 [Artemia franciscana]|uniref:Gamma-soluble NSF attachment protein n=1 Tax=Artemia franciscana TaxID=6661 RepID=A0AA88IFX2_ARTSF|nr:hypothetical protein QYM36_000803 [Artemia franciscana]
MTACQRLSLSSTVYGQVKSGSSLNGMGGYRKERLKGNGNFLGGCKVGPFKKIGMEEERVQLCWPQATWCCCWLCIDQVIAIAKDLNQFDVIPDLAHKACNLYLEYGAPDTAAISLDKAAKAIANDLPEEAMKLYIRAADVVDTEERPRDAAEYIGKAARSMVTLKKYEDATKAILKEMGHHQTAGNTPALGRCTVALVLVVLAQEDVIEAKKMFEQWGSTCDSEEIYSLSQIIQGYEEDDPDLVKQGLSSSFIRSMDVAYAKLARDLSLPNVTQATSSEKPDKVEPPIVQSPIEEDEDNELDRLEAKMNAMRAQEEIGNEEKNYTKEDEEEEELDLK